MNHIQNCNKDNNKNCVVAVSKYDIKNLKNKVATVC